MVTTSISARAIPRTSAARAREVNEAEFRATLAALRALDDGAWGRPTACAGWTVRDMTAHVVGQYEELPRPWVAVRRIRRARQTHPALGPLDGHNETQIADRAAVAPRALIGDFAQLAPQGIRAIQRMPGPVRRTVRLSILYPEAKNLPENSMDYLNSVLMARDTWMHRVDIGDATGTGTVLDEHDREIVGQIVLDLALGWTGPAVTVELQGPAGGQWELGTGPPAATLRTDAVAFARHLSGRPALGALEFEGDPDAVATLTGARVLF